MKSILITGATGFVGSYLAEHLLSQGALSLHGTSYHSQGITSEKGIRLHQVDLTQKEQVNKLIGTVKPQEIYHLAAFTSPADSFKNPERTLTNNLLSELYLFDAIKEAGLTPRVLITSTAEVYGKIKPEDLPIDETTPLRPGSPYAVSKIGQEYLALQYHIANNLDVIIARAFNHTGPRQVPAFVVPSFAKQIAEIEKGNHDPVMKVGNLEAKKDFTDVRDIVKGYVLLIEKGKAGDVYNLGSGKSVQIKTILETLLSFTNTSVSVEQDPSLYRPIDTPEVICDASKAMALTGWKVEIPLEKSLVDTLEYFRKLV